MFKPDQGTPQNLSKKSHPGSGSVHSFTNFVLKVAIFGLPTTSPKSTPRLMECPFLYNFFTLTDHYRARPKSPQNCRVATKKKSYSGEKALILDQLVPNWTKRCLQKLLNSFVSFESFKVCRFHENDSTLGSGGLHYLSLIGILSNVF